MGTGAGVGGVICDVGSNVRASTTGATRCTSAPDLVKHHHGAPALVHHGELAPWWCLVNLHQSFRPVVPVKRVNELRGENYVFEVKKGEVNFGDILLRYIHLSPGDIFDIFAWRYIRYILPSLVIFEISAPIFSEFSDI